MDEKAVKYVQEYLHRGYTATQVAEHLHNYGWPEQDIEDALTAVARRHKRRALFMASLAGFVALLALGILTYFIVIEPAFVAKPAVEQPSIVSESVSRTAQTNGLPGTAPGLLTRAVPLVDTKHLVYVLTELGAYKLHENPLTGDIPEMEIYLKDIQQTFTVTVDENNVHVRDGIAESPDVRIDANQNAVVALATANNPFVFKTWAAQLLREYEQRGYTATLLTSEKDLLLKGYLALYEQNQEAIEDAGITGGAIVELPLLGSGMIGMYVIVLALWSALLVRMRLGK
jgi:hypothetical protein